MRENENGAQRFLLESWLDFGEVSGDDPDLRRVLFDPVTGLPTTPLLFPRISSLLEDRGEVSLLCVNVVQYSRIEEIYGWQVFDDVMRQVAEALDEIAGETLRDADVIAELMSSGNAFVIVLSPPRTTDRIDPAARYQLARRIESKIAEKLEKRIEPALYRKFGCYVGSSTVRSDGSMRLQRLVYDALDEAFTDSNERVAADTAERVARLRHILEGEDIRTLVHPMFDLTSMEVIGYEALSRGPEGSEFERPDKLFTVAYDADLVMRLERVCRKRALEMVPSLPKGRLLFLNVEPEAISDPRLREAVIGQSEERVDPSQIVLELTERTAITDFGSFRCTLDFVRALGFSVAVDDAGAGYGSLQVVAEVHPEWLKVDISLVRGCDHDAVRSKLIESLVGLADQVGSKLVAEGIETEAELETLRKLGVPYGQGYLLAKPSATIEPDKDLPARKYAK
jgi:EAL domain-containing protein (putative c-di-GMP-specific phosphodiesterase class I)/GGDEF domain-containing protein